MRRQKPTRVEILSTAGKFSLRARRLWRQLKHEFESEPQQCNELAELASVATGAKYALLAQELLAKTWFDRRTPELAAAVERSGSVCRFVGGVAMVESATVAKRLGQFFTFSDSLYFLRMSENFVLQSCSSSLAEHEDTAESMLTQLNDVLDRLKDLSSSFEKMGHPNPTIDLERWFIDEWMRSANRSYESYLTALIADRKIAQDWPLIASPQRFVQRILQKKALSIGNEKSSPDALIQAMPQLILIGETRGGKFFQNLMELLRNTTPMVIGHLAQSEEFDRHNWLQRLVLQYPKPPTVDIISKVWEVWFRTVSEARLTVLRSWNEPMQISTSQGDQELSDALLSYVMLSRFDDLASRPLVELTRNLGLLLQNDDASVRSSIRYGIHGELWTSHRKHLTDSVMRGTETNLSISSAMGNFDPVAYVSGKTSVEQRICEALEIVPDDEIDRALFFLLTTQIDKLLVFDPELEQLSLGYIAASDEFRERLRPLLNAHPKLNIGRILASVLRQDRLARLKDKEVAYFVEQLLQRRDFGSVWKLAQNHSTFTLMWILARVRQLDDAEAPADQEFAELVERAHKVLEQYVPSLLTSEPGPLAGFAEARANELSASNVSFGKYIASLRFDGRINDFSFSPDGLRLAVAGSNRVIGEVDLVTAKLRQKFEGFFGASVGSIAYCGNRSIVAAERTSLSGKQCYVWICEEGTAARWVQRSSGSVTSAVSVGDQSVQYATKDGVLGLIRVDASGSASKVLDKSLSINTFTYPRALAENARGEFNVWFGENGAVIRNSDLSQVDVMHGVKPMMRRAAWIDDKLVVASDHAGRLHYFSVDEKLGNLRRGHSIRVSERITDFAVIAGTDELIMQVPGRLLLYKSSTQTHLASTGRHGTSVQISRDGSLLASGDEDGDIILYDLSIRAIPSFAARPIGLTSPNDLPRYQRAVAAVALEKSTEPATKLMAAITEIMLMLVRFRFRHDIFLDEPTTLRSGEYDIVLGGSVGEDDDGEEGSE